MLYLPKDRANDVDRVCIGQPELLLPEELPYTLFTIVSNMVKLHPKEAVNILGVMELVKTEYVRTFITPDLIQEKYDEAEEVVPPSLLLLDEELPD